MEYLVGGGVAVLGVFIVALVRDYFRPLLDMRNRHVLITGGSSGFGKDIAMEARRMGANVTIVARTKSKLDKAQQEIVKIGDESVKDNWVDVLALDISKDFSAVATSVNAYVERRGKIDVLINCAGKATPGRFMEQDLRVADEMMQVNYMGSVYMTHAVLPQRPARVAFVSSAAGFIGVYGYAHYSASKYALRGFAEVLAMELRSRGTKITLALPPDMDTPGLEEENKTKPEETKLISDAFSADTAVLARAFLRDIRRGEFFSTNAIDMFVLSAVGAGMHPVTSWTSTLLEVASMGLLRVVAIAILGRFNSIVDKCAKKREASEKKDT